MKKLFIFDFDGVLVDTILDSVKAFNQVLSEYDKPTYSENVTNFRHEDFWEFIKLNVYDFKEEFYMRFLEVYTKSELENTKPYDGIIDVLNNLKKQDISLAICSNREEPELHFLCDRYLKEVDFNYISGYRKGVPNKPNPYRLNEIIEKVNIPKEEVIYFGDRIVDIEAAENAGIEMILVTYGQGNPEDYSNPYPLVLIDSPNEIKDIIKKGII